MADFRIHGDNIVECERTLALIVEALGVALPLFPHGSPLAPSYSFVTPGTTETLNFTFFPGYGRWDVDILEVVRRGGGRLREAADTIVCRVTDGLETPLLAIEYCGALPAGNQAWQRNGRAFSFAHSGLPYLYIAELSGFELNAARERKAARLPNPAVPFSYLLLTESVKSAAIPIFVRSPGASADAVRAHTPFYGEAELLEILRLVLVGGSTKNAIKALESKVLALVRFLADSRRRKDTLTPDQWTAALDSVIKGNTLPDFLASQPPIPWSKTAYIDGLTATAEKLMANTSRLARGLTAESLPMCLVLGSERKRFADAIAALYPAASKSFLEWCRRDGHLAICWVMGFKPRGDDARPDRGLPPLCRMLSGDSTDLLTIVYGPAPRGTWEILEKNPALLMRGNGLWEAVLTCGDAVLIDSDTLRAAPPLTYLKSHWQSAIPPISSTPFAVTPVPTSAGEHDVDTALHLLLARLAHPNVFEGLCNPPGGDWSGLSMLTEDRATEHRWLVLPRVTAVGSKRPDHLFQIFGVVDPFLMLVVESKETPQSVETKIGPRLLKYVGDLIATAPSVHRASSTSAWSHYDLATRRHRPQVASAAAFVASKASELADVAARAQTDLVLGFMFSAKRDACTLLIRCCTPLGEKVAKFLLSVRPQNLNLEIKIQS